MKKFILCAVALAICAVGNAGAQEPEGLGISREDVLGIFKGTGIRMPDPATRGSLFESPAYMSVKNQGYPRLNVPKTNVLMSGPREDLQSVALVSEASNLDTSIETAKTVFRFLDLVIGWDAETSEKWLTDQLEEEAPCMEDNYKPLDDRRDIGFSKCHWRSDGGDLTISIRRRPEAEAVTAANPQITSS